MKLRLEYVYLTASFISIIQIIIFFTSLDIEVEGWGKDIPRNINLYITDGKPQIIPSNFCESQVTLLIIVTSAPSNVDARQAIRQTWGSHKTILGESVNVLFFIGDSLEPSIKDALILESEHYKDIIKEDFVDSYNNLTLKSVLMLKVASQNCMNKAKYLMKTDDDVFVNLPRLMKLLVQKNKFKNFLLGRMWCSPKVLRNPLDKWYTPFYLYNSTSYPNYISGSAYVMSLDVTKSLYDAALKIPLFHLEDIFVTGIVAQYVGIIPENNALFTAGPVSNEICHLKDLLTMHYISPESIRQTFEAMNKSYLMEKCSAYKPMFNVQIWIKNILFGPISRLKRQQICF